MKNAMYLGDELARAIRVRKMMTNEVLECLQIQYPLQCTVRVTYERAGSGHQLHGVVTGYDVQHDATTLIIRNIATGKSRKFDVTCYPVVKVSSGCWVDDTGEARVTPRPAPHKRPPHAAQGKEGR